MSKTTIFSAADKRFIKVNSRKMTGSDMARKLKVDKGVMRRYLRNNGLVPTKKQQRKLKAIAMRKAYELKAQSKYRKDDKVILKKYLTTPVKKIGAMINRDHGFITRRLASMGLKVPLRLINKRKRDSWIKHGHVPFNKGMKQTEYMSKDVIARTKKTRFKKGNIPPNTLEKDGTITVRHGHKKRGSQPYKYIRVSLGVSMPLHQYMWEKKHGKLPAGRCLWFKDGDTMNCTLKNLEVITRGENMRRNSASINLTDGYVAYTIATRRNPELTAVIKKDKDLIRIKRHQILLKRKIKSI